MSESQVKDAVCSGRTNSVSATYHLLYNRLQKGLDAPDPPVDFDLKYAGFIKSKSFGVNGSMETENSFKRHRKYSRFAREKTRSSHPVNRKANDDGKVGHLRSSESINTENEPDSKTHIDVKQGNKMSEKQHDQKINMQVTDFVDLQTVNHKSDQAFREVHDRAETDYKMFLMQLRQQRERPNKGILKQDAQEAPTVASSNDVSIKPPVRIPYGDAPCMVTRSNERNAISYSDLTRHKVPDSEDPKDNYVFMEVPGGESQKRLKSAKSVRFEVDSHMLDISSRNSSQNDPLIASGVQENAFPNREVSSARSEKKTLEKYVVHRLSAQGRSRKDWLVMAKSQRDQMYRREQIQRELQIQEETQMELRNSTESAPEPLKARQSYPERLRAMEILRKTSDFQQTPPAAPPNSASGGRRPFSSATSYSTYNTSTSTKTSTISKSHDSLLEKRPRFSHKHRHSNTNNNKHDLDQYKLKVRNSVDDRVVVWDLNVTDMSAQGIGQRAKTLPDITLRKLGTLRNQNTFHGVKASSK